MSRDPQELLALQRGARAALAPGLGETPLRLRPSSNTDVYTVRIKSTADVRPVLIDMDRQDRASLRTQYRYLRKRGLFPDEVRATVWLLFPNRFRSWGLS